MYIYNRNQAYILSLYILIKKHILYVYIRARKKLSRQEQGSIHTLYVYTIGTKYIYFLCIYKRKETYFLCIYNSKETYSLCIYNSKEGRKHTTGSKYTYSLRIYNRKQAYILFIYKSKEGTKYTTVA
jgi:hypothetical protein